VFGAKGLSIVRFKRQYNEIEDNVRVAGLQSSHSFNESPEKRYA
jgi:hypothetical protein